MDYKVCTKCGEKLPNTEEFFRVGRHQCRKCNTEYSRQWRKNNKDRSRVWINSNKISSRKANKKWHSANKDKVLVLNAKRRSDKLNQTPVLTDLEKQKISLYYKISAYLGDFWHVDHAIPLSKGGLHHPDNLQIISAEENLKKNASLDYKIKGHVIKI